MSQRSRDSQPYQTRGACSTAARSSSLVVSERKARLPARRATPPAGQPPALERCCHRNCSSSCSCRLRRSNAAIRTALAPARLTAKKGAAGLSAASAALAGPRLAQLPLELYSACGGRLRWTTAVLCDGAALTPRSVRLARPCRPPPSSSLSGCPPAARSALSAAVGGWAEPLLGSAAALAATPLPPRCTHASSPHRIRRAAAARLSLELHSVPTA